MLKIIWISYYIKLLIIDIKNKGFDINNLPFGIFYKKNDVPNKKGCSRIGNYIIDLSYLEENVFITNYKVFSGDSLNNFIKLGKYAWKSIRNQLKIILNNHNMIKNKEKFWIHIKKVNLNLPIEIKEYTDFYASKNHAENVGKLFRKNENALTDNYLLYPLAYNGRSSTIQVSKAKIKNPKGWIKNKDGSISFKKSEKLDFELEIGVIIGKENQIGKPINIKNAEDYIFGFVLLNDLSARDIQYLEYRPLGPFNSKNFSSVISPWIITKDALEEFKKPINIQSDLTASYWKYKNLFHYDIFWKVYLKRNKKTYLLSETNYQNLYWTATQLICQHTVTGTNLRIGDLIGTGTISGKNSKELGCLLEITKNGTDPLKLEENLYLNFLKKNDEIILKGYSRNKHKTISFGENKIKII